MLGCRLRSLLPSREARTLARQPVPEATQSESPQSCESAVTRKLHWFATCADQAIFVGGADGRVEWANEAACRLCGAPLEELVGRRVHLFPDAPDAQREASEHIGRQVAAGESARLEAALRDRAGRALWIDLQVMPVPAEGDAPAGWVAVAHDVTERKRAEAEIAESEERYRSLVEGSPEPVAVHSQGRVVYANPAALELLGARSHDEVLGRPIFDFVHPDFHGLAAERILKMELVGDPAERVVETLLRVDGSPVDVELAATPITWRGAPAIQLAGRASDRAPEHGGRARAPLLDLSSLVLELAPCIEGRIAPRAVVSFDLTGALVAVPGEAGSLAELVCAVVRQAAAALPGGAAGSCCARAFASSPRTRWRRSCRRTRSRAGTSSSSRPGRTAGGSTRGCAPRSSTRRTRSASPGAARGSRARSGSRRPTAARCACRAATMGACRSRSRFPPLARRSGWPPAAGPRPPPEAASSEAPPSPTRPSSARARSTR